MPFYAVPSNIAALLQKNPNIVDKKEAASLNEWRHQMEELLVLFRTDEDTVEADADRLKAGRDKMNTSVEDDRIAEKEAREELEEQAAAQTAEQIEELGDDFWTTDM